MSITKRLRLVVALAAVALAARIVLAQSTATSPTPATAVKSLTDSLRADSSVRSGVLPNGLRYFIKRNGKPEARLSLRLAVNAGSAVETEDQRGLAHFVEHMNFNGSSHFATADELVAYMQSIGMRFGADVNAYTSFDETVYMLEVPTDRDSLLDRGFMALSDFAGRAKLSEVEINKERGVVLEEWRLGRGAGERIQRKQFPLLLRGSRYATRLPIGQPEVLRKGPSARLRDYYRTWYTPERMAVIAVGDAEPARMDSLIRVHFSDLPARPDAKPTPTFEVPPHTETLVSIATDKEATTSTVSLYFKHPHRGERTVAELRRALAEALFSSMLNERLDEIAQRADAPFLSAGARGSSFSKTLDLYVVSARVANGGIERGLSGLLQEVGRVRQHGFLESELTRAKDELSAENESAYAERDKTESSDLADELVDSYLSGEPALGIEAGYRFTRDLLPGITLRDVSARLPQLIRDQSRVVLISAPDKPGVRVPTEAAVRARITRAAQGKVAAWVDTSSSRALMSRLPDPGTVTARRVIDEIGATVLTLSNGVEVWLKPTDFQADEIQFSAYALGGLSLADSTGFPTASLIPAVVNALGVGGFTSPELEKLLAGKLVRVGTSYAYYTHGVSGGSRPADLETALQLVHLGFTDLTPDRAAFVALQKRLRAAFAERTNNPEQVFADTLNAVNSGRFYMSRVPTVRDVDAMGLEPILEFHRRRFANAADFTFFFAGTFSVDSITPLIARYLGSLPSTGRRTSTYRSVGPRFPRGLVTARVHKGIEPKTHTQITFFHSGELEELELHRARACANILNDHLRENLRELLGATYGASASTSFYAPLPGFTTASIDFSCAPENVEKVTAAALAEVKKLREQGPSAADLQKDKEVERRELEVAMKQNAFWTGSMQTVHVLGWDVRRIAKRRERIDLLTVENVKATFQRYFPLDHYSVVTLLPEAGGEPARKTGSK